MPTIWIALLAIAIGVAGYLIGRRRAMSSAGGRIRNLHSLPNFYGMSAALSGLVPALLVLGLWTLAQPLVLQNTISDMISQDQLESTGSLGLAMSDVRRVADGLDLAVSESALSAEEASSIGTDLSEVRALLGEIGVALGSDVSQETLRAAQAYRGQSATGDLFKTLVVLAIALGGTALAIWRITAAFRARNFVETGVRMLLIAAASIAVLTTVGIFLSLIFNTVEFFRLYPAWDFFFGTTWQPSFSGRGGASQLGVVPLLWGTLYISLIALAVAVPIGLLSAIYLSEYASPRVRAFAKPMLEVLAGIPTIVYGLFALLTVGPLLVTVFGDNTVGWMRGGTAVMTAGLVMGIMLIPFVSSLSDDIINSVPQAMRDGSLGLGATHAETVRQVVLPAALPGVVGAILLAASRAIGETMIVVLGAGAAARLSLNPFEAMTTVTAKIVSQLTGDSDFSSPEALVAFALGMTLFVITLGLNVVALYIVRKYREQYE